MLTQSISNGLLKEFARRKSGIDFIEEDSICHSRSSSIKREVKSPSSTELEEPPLKLSKSNNFSSTFLRNKRAVANNIAKEQPLFLPPNEMLTRNYSDIMRNLAEKYNNNDFEQRIQCNSEKFDSNHTDSLHVKNKIITSNVENDPVFDSNLHPMSFLTSYSLSSGIIPHILDMTSTQALVTLAKIAREAEVQKLIKDKLPNSTLFFNQPLVPAVKGQITTAPLDLSSQATSKRVNAAPSFSENKNVLTSLLCNQTNKFGNPKELKSVCQSYRSEVYSWSLEQVCNFVESIDICAEYVQNFRDQSIDGIGLVALTEEHLTKMLGMKLGPALKLKSILHKKLRKNCDCQNCLKCERNLSDLNVLEKL